MTEKRRFKDDRRVKDWCMKLPDESDNPIPKIRSIRESTPSRVRMSSDKPISAASTSTLASGSRRLSLQAPLKKNSVSSSQASSNKVRPRSASLPGATSTSTPRSSGSIAQSPISSRRTSVSSSSAGSISIAPSLLQEDHDPRAMQPSFYRKLKPVLPGEAHNEDGRFKMDMKTEDWKSLRKQAQPRIDKEGGRDGGRYAKNCASVYGDLMARFDEICMLPQEISRKPLHELHPKVMKKLKERFEVAYDMAAEALANADVREIDGNSMSYKFTKDFLTYYWRAIPAYEQLFTMWADIQSVEDIRRHSPNRGRKRQTQDRKR